MRALIGYSNSGNPMAIHLPAIHTQFAPEIVAIFARIKELKSSFCAILSHCLSIILR